MAIRVIADSLAEIPAALHDSVQVNDDGTAVYTVGAVEGWAFENVRSLKATIASERKRAEDAERERTSQLAGYRDESGALLDAEAARSSLARVTELEEQIASGSPDIEAERDRLKQEAAIKEKRLVDRHRLDIDEREKALASLQGNYRRTVIRNAATEAVAELGGAKNKRFLVPEAEKLISVAQREDGSLQPVVLDEDGGVRITMTAGSQDAMSPTERLTMLRDSDPAIADLFPAVDARGSGLKGADRNGARVTTSDLMKIEDPAERIKAMRERGLSDPN